MDIVVFKWKGNVSTPLPSRDMVRISGVKYDGNYVNKHFESIGKVLDCPFTYTCVTDDPTDISSDIRIVKLWDYLGEFGGCLRRLYVYSNEAKDILGDKIFTVDLDTVFIKDFSHLYTLDVDFNLYRSLNPERAKSGQTYRIHPGNGVIKPGIYNEVWADVQEDTLAKLTQSRKYFTGTDQSWFNYHFNLHKPNLNIKYFDNTNGMYEALDIIFKYRGKLPEDCIFMQWSGPRDPREPKWREKLPWLEEYL